MQNKQAILHQECLFMIIMSLKHKQSVLSIKDKQSIILQLEKGEESNNLLAEYGISISGRYLIFARTRK